MSTEMTTLDYTLVGPHAGQTIKYMKGQYHFINGVLTVSVREDQKAKFDGLTRLLARCYNAHPAGSKALEKAQAEWDLNPASKKGKAHAAGQKVQTGKAKAPSEAVDDGADDGAEAGSEGHEAEAGDSNDAGEGEGDVPNEVAVALGKLDPANDKHWTSTGLPNLKALAEVLGRAVTRVEIEEVVPGFNREVASQAE